MFLAVLTLMNAVVMLAGRTESVSPLVAIGLAALLALAAVGLGVIASAVRLWHVRREIRKLHRDTPMHGEPWRLR